MTTLPSSQTISSVNDQAAAKTYFEAIRDVVAELISGSAEEQIEIASGAITPTVAVVQVDTEAQAASDTLATINNANMPDGRHIFLRSTDAARVVTVTHASGVIEFLDNQNKVLLPEQWVWLIRDGSAWREFSINVNAASETATGVVELATSAETQTGTDTDRAVTPAGLHSKTASTTVIGLVELATQAEAEAQSDTTRAVTPVGLANFLRTDADDQSFTGGVEVTSNNLGTRTTGTETLDVGKGPIQRIINGGAHTIDPPAAEGSMILLVTNNASAGAVTFGAGWEHEISGGDSLTTTNGDDFLIFVYSVNSIQSYNIRALQ